VLPPYQVWTVKSKVETTKDMQGLKLRTTGGAQDLTLRALNAVPVRMAAPDAYESLSRGTMDGLLFPLDSVVSYGLDKLVKHATEGVSFGSFIVAYSINQSVWNKLPDDVKKAMDEASEAITPRACADVDKEGEVTKKQMQDEGVSFDPLPEATRAEIKDKLKGVGKEWASGLDSRGKQASAALKEFEDLLAAGGTK